MPSRHSKNNSAGSVFTYRERQRTAWGTQRARITSDSVVPFDACNICLHTAQTPVTCHRGHVYCRACIVESLALQRERQRSEERKGEERQQRRRVEEERAEAERSQRETQRFVASAASIHSASASPSALPSLSSSSASTASPAGYEPVQTRRGVAYVVSGPAHSSPLSALTLRRL